MTDRVVDLVLPVDDQTLADDLRIVRDSFGLGAISELTFLTAGLMNQNWRVSTASGVYALKRISDVDSETARRNLRVMGQLALLGRPVCTPVATHSGDYIVEVGGNAYCLVPWVSGTQPRGFELSFGQAGELGVCLGLLHKQLNSFRDVDLESPSARPVGRVADPRQALGEADRFLSYVECAGTTSSFDLAVADFLEQRKLLLGKYEHLRPSDDAPAGPFGWTHGDFQHLNVIWRNGEVAAVIDWDRIKVRPFGEEIARSATLLFSHDGGWLDLKRVSAFVGGYRSVVTITDEEVLDAVNRLWWRRMCDYWHLEFHYHRNDHACDHLFLSASRFLAWWTERFDEVREAFAVGG